MKTAELHMFSVKSDRDQTQPRDSAGKRAREIPVHCTPAPIPSSEPNREVQSRHARMNEERWP